jgi:hypothetical protein
MQETAPRELTSVFDDGIAGAHIAADHVLETGCEAGVELSNFIDGDRGLMGFPDFAWTVRG